MPKASPIQTSFNSGILSERGVGRVDLSRYASSARKMVNLLPVILGPAVKRSGTEFQVPVKYHDRFTRLIEFEPSITSSYMLEFGHQYVRVMNGDGSQLSVDVGGISDISNVAVVTSAGHGLVTGQEITITGVVGMTQVNGRRFLTGAVTTDTFEILNLFGGSVDASAYDPYIMGGSIQTPYEVVTPYLEDDLGDLQVEQSVDVLHIVHGDYPQATLSRVTPTEFVYGEIEFTWPAFTTTNFDDSQVMTIAASLGTTVATTNFDHFVPSMVGSHVEISEVIESSTKEWQPEESYNIGSKVRYDGSVYAATSSGTSSTNPPVHLSGIESDGAVDWEYYHSGKGFFEIIAVTDARTADVQVRSRLPITALTGTFRWAESEWSEHRGYPRALAFHDLRMYYAGTRGSPQTIWASEVDNFVNFKRLTGADQSFSYTINSKQNNTVQWMMTGNVLAIGTSRNEFVGHGNRIEDAINAEEVRLSDETGYGSKLIQPVRVGSTIVFVERRGKKMREYVYDFNINKYKAGDLTVFSEGTMDSEITDISYQQSPNQIIWVTTKNGKLFGMTYDKDQEVVGFHSHSIGGEGLVDSTATTAYSEGDEDRLWMVVRRTIGGVTRRYIETLSPQFDLNGDPTDARFLDSGSTDLERLDHLEGEDVTVVIEGATVGGTYTVVDGKIDPPRPNTATKFAVGYPYTAVLETNRVDAGAADGTAQAKLKRIHNMAVRVIDTGPGLWFGVEGNMDEFHLRQPSDLMNHAVPLTTGDLGPNAWPEGIEQDGIMRFEHRLPLPFTIAAVMPQLVTQDNR